MLSGRLNKFVSIEKRSESKNTIGEDITSWVNFKDVYANIQPVSAKEYLANNEIQSNISSKITIRYTENITPDMRIRYNARIFNIMAPPINTEERNKELILMCEEQI